MFPVTDTESVWYWCPARAVVSLIGSLLTVRVSAAYSCELGGFSHLVGVVNDLPNTLEVGVVGAEH